MAVSIEVRLMGPAEDDEWGVRCADCQEQPWYYLDVGLYPDEALAFADRHNAENHAGLASIIQIPEVADR